MSYNDSLRYAFTIYRKRKHSLGYILGREDVICFNVFSIIKAK